MFNRKRKTPKYKFAYGKSPVLDRSSISKNRKNPRIPQKKNPIFKKIKKLTFISFALAIIIFTLYIFLISDYFSITTIKNINNELENETLCQQIKEKLQKSIGKNILLVDTSELEKEIQNSFFQLEEVEITRDYPSTLLVEFFEHPLTMNIINESNNIRKAYIINSIGFVVKEDYENPNLPYLRIKSDEPLNTENAVIDSSTLNYITEARNYFEEKFGMRVAEVIYKPNAREIHLLTERDFSIWLDIQRPYENQLKKLKKALVKLDIYQDELEYIDLRIAGESGEKIIYKRR